MRLRPATILHVLQLAALRCAWLLVPGRRRSEWWKEWRAELWHVRQACTPAHGVLWSGEREVAEFCMGAFQDALCLRGLPGQRRIPLATTMGSATQCILWLAGLAVVSFGAAQLLPGVDVARRSVVCAIRRRACNLMLIRDGAYGDVFAADDPRGNSTRRGRTAGSISSMGLPSTR